MIDYTLPLDQLPDPLPIEPLTRSFDVSITPPGSKSITCRAYVLAALAEGTSRIIRPLRADDTEALLTALCTLGAKAEWVRATDRPGDDSPDDVLITGVNGRFPHGGNLFMGEGGAPTRFMIACACLAAQSVTIDASPRMRERPIAEGVEMLQALGATIEYVEEEGRLPVRVTPSAEFKGGTLKVGKTASSQFISAMMLIAPWLDNGLTLELHDTTSASYVSLTRSVLAEFGGKASQNFLAHFSNEKLRRVSIRHDALQACSFGVEADASSALYWVLAAMLNPMSKYHVQRIPLLSKQPDSDALDGMEQMGGTVDFCDASDYGTELDEGLACGPKKIKKDASFQADCSAMPDGSIAYAVGAAACSKPSLITGLHTLRHKESDRLAALEAELTKIGCVVETGKDWIKITPMQREHGRDTRATGSGDTRDTDAERRRDAHRSESGATIIETYNDHRMAMAFAVLGLARPGISIRNPACVSKSYPTFWKDFAKLYKSQRA